MEPTNREPAGSSQFAQEQLRGARSSTVRALSAAVKLRLIRTAESTKRECPEAQERQAATVCSTLATAKRLPRSYGARPHALPPAHCLQNSPQTPACDQEDKSALQRKSASETHLAESVAAITARKNSLVR
jgi:hypothetical protein